MQENKIDYPFIDINELKPYENNARLHPQEQINKIVNSIKEFGFITPVIIDENNTILVGHGRTQAAKAAGLTKVPYRRITNLTDEQKRAYILADNKLSDIAEWDEELLKIELENISLDMTAFGFDDFTIDIDEDDLEVVEDEVPEPPEEPKAKLGDIYKLGDHRLICGDSTDIAVIDRLMDGVKADMVFTDPPYNIGYQGVNDKRTVQNDKMDDERFVEWLKSSLMNCETMYVCCSWQCAHLFRRAIEENGNKIKAMIVWDKVNPAQHLDKYFKQHEIIWYCGKFGGEKTLRGDIWQVKRQANTVHPTMKPIELIAMALQDNPDKKIVYDGFGGSGSTLIACEQLNRKCYMCELDPHYIDVIIERWENLTGQKAELIKGGE